MLNNIRQFNCKINQTLFLYEHLGEDINDQYFQDVAKSVKQDEDNKKAENMEESHLEKENSNDNNENLEESFERKDDKGSEDEDSDNDRDRDYT